MVKENLSLLAPHLIIVLAIFVQTVMGLIKSPRLAFRYKSINILTSNTITLGAFFLATFLIFFLWGGLLTFPPALVVTPLVKVCSLLILFTSITTVLLNGNLLNENRQSCYKYHILLLTSVLGAMVSVCANDFLTLFVALETMSFGIYFLIAFSRGYESKEASLKYLITNSVSMAFFLFGVSYLMGLTSSINFEEITQLLLTPSNGILYSLAALFIFLGIVMKLAIFPFANWVVDVYAGVETSVLTYLSSVPKIAVVCILLRLLSGVFSFSLELTISILLIAIITAFWANVYAVKENNLKKILACSSSANAAYMLVAIPLIPVIGNSAVIFYLISYIIMNIGVWAYLNLLEHKIENWKLSSIKHSDNLLLVGIFVLLIIGLAGLPISIGFVSKIYLLYTILSSGILYLPILFVLLVLFAIALYYYIKILKTITNEVAAIKGKMAKLVLYLAGILTFVLGIIPFGLISYCVNVFN